MCGIFGYIGSRQASEILLTGLARLEYRGYDSAGIVVKNGILDCYKSVGKVSELIATIDDMPEGRIGVAHTRWATHGGVTHENAHPHLSSSGKVAVVHNGIIENSKTLRKMLESRGIVFKSETDSENLAHLIEIYLESGYSPLNSVRLSLKRVVGTWGVAVVFKEHDLIICGRNGSPLVVGIGDQENVVSSDPHALSEHTSEVVFLEDGELAEITAEEVKVSRLDGSITQTNITQLEEDWGEAELGDYPHFMLKEMFEQPEALVHCISGRLNKKTGNARLQGLNLTRERMQQIPHVRLLGCGTALHACQIGQLALEKLARIPSVAHIASEFRNNDPVINPLALHFAVSQSGETADTLSAVKHIQSLGAEVHGVINVVGSSIARQSGQGVYIHSGPEQAVASTKAFTNMVAALMLFAIQLGRTRGLASSKAVAIADAMEKLPEQMSEYLSSPGSIAEAVDLVKDAKQVLFLGRGISAPVASEGALKLMELAYIPCLAYPAGEMKHGPIALLEEGSPVVVIAPDDHLKEKTISAIHECRARGAKIILIHTNGDPIAEEGDVSIGISPTHYLLSPILSVIPLQLIAYHTALELGCDVDRPRNLAKSVTVE